MAERHNAHVLSAMHDFKRARQRGALETVVANLTGRSQRLLSYEEVSDHLHTGEPIARGLQEIPLDAIVGSVGRYADFTRSFLPRHESAADRWTRVRAAFNSVDEIPPIDVYQVGGSYFVLDGNHRVSVARVLGASHIPAYVTEVETRVPLSPDVQPDDLIIQAQYSDFLEETKLDEARPDADLTVTAPGQYRVLKKQIDRHARWFADRRKSAGGEAPGDLEAIGHWYDEFYLPVVRLIRRRDILDYFPGRTETDLYAWITSHREELEEELGRSVETNTAASDLLNRFGEEPQPVASRLRRRLLKPLIPNALESGPPPGEWREMQVADRERTYLFANILVPVDGGDCDWQALEQAVTICRREASNLNGLHIYSGQSGEKRSAAVEAGFHERLDVMGVEGAFIVERGRLARSICRQAQWHDIVVMGLCEPPGPGSAGRLLSSFGTLVRSCGRPVLAVPGKASPLERPLLAYDGSPKAREALFVSAYLAAKWETPLTVVTVATEQDDASRHEAEGVQEDARFYLIARGISADYVIATGEPAPAIEQTAAERGCDFLIMGGYGYSPLLEVVLGSTVDEVLQAGKRPVLVCR